MAHTSLTTSNFKGLVSLIKMVAALLSFKAKQPNNLDAQQSLDLLAKQLLKHCEDAEEEYEKGEEEIGKRKTELTEHMAEVMKQLMELEEHTEHTERTEQMELTKQMVELEAQMEELEETTKTQEGVSEQIKLEKLIGSMGLMMSES